MPRASNIPWNTALVTAETARNTTAQMMSLRITSHSSRSSRRRWVGGSAVDVEHVALVDLRTGHDLVRREPELVAILRVLRVGPTHVHRLAVEEVLDAGVEDEASGAVGWRGLPEHLNLVLRARVALTPHVGHLDAAAVDASPHIIRLFERVAVAISHEHVDDAGRDRQRERLVGVR